MATHAATHLADFIIAKLDDAAAVSDADLACALEKTLSILASACLARRDAIKYRRRGAIDAALALEQTSERLTALAASAQLD